MRSPRRRFEGERYQVVALALGFEADVPLVRRAPPEKVVLSLKGRRAPPQRVSCLNCIETKLAHALIEVGHTERIP